MTKAAKRSVETLTPSTAPQSTEKVEKPQPGNNMTDTRLGKKETSAIFDPAPEVLIGAIRTGQAVGLPGLETLSDNTAAPCQGVKPGSAENIQIPIGKKSQPQIRPGHQTIPLHHSKRAIHDFGAAPDPDISSAAPDSGGI